MVQQGINLVGNCMSRLLDRTRHACCGRSLTGHTTRREFCSQLVALLTEFVHLDQEQVELEENGRAEECECEDVKVALSSKSGGKQVVEVGDVSCGIDGCSETRGARASNGPGSFCCQSDAGNASDRLCVGRLDGVDLVCNAV